MKIRSRPPPPIRIERPAMPRSDRAILDPQGLRDRFATEAPRPTVPMTPAPGYGTPDALKDVMADL